MIKGKIIDPSKFKSSEELEMLKRILTSGPKDSNGKILRVEDTDEDGTHIASIMRSILSQYPEEILGKDFKEILGEDFKGGSHEQRPN